MQQQPGHNDSAHRGLQAQLHRLCALALQMAEPAHNRNPKGAALQDEAQELLASYERKQLEAEKEAEAIVAQAREEAERLSSRAAEELEHQVSRRRQMALDRIGQAEQDAVRDVRSAAVDLALKATRKLLDDKIGDTEQARLVDDAIGEIGKRLH